MNKLDLQIQQAAQYFTYSEYKKMVADLFEDGKATGPKQTTTYTESTKMSIQRMKKWDKIFKVSEDVKSRLTQLEDHWTWYVITEGWCGDASQVLPVIAKIASHSDRIDLKLILRDENTEIMNNYLTNGGMAIPILVAVNERTGEELPHWGPRPAFIAQKLAALKSDNPNIEYAEVSKQLHTWYAKDKGESTQNDLLKLMTERMLSSSAEFHTVG
jgi:hypothetical protein